LYPLEKKEEKRYKSQKFNRHRKRLQDFCFSIPGYLIGRGIWANSRAMKGLKGGATHPSV